LNFLFMGNPSAKQTGFSIFEAFTLDKKEKFFYIYYENFQIGDPYVHI